MFNGTTMEDIPRVQTDRTEPEIHKKADGYLLICRTSESVYLGFWDSMRYRLGLTSIQELEQEYLDKQRIRAEKARLRNKFMRL